MSTTPSERPVKSQQKFIYIIYNDDKNITLQIEGSNKSKVTSENQVLLLSLINRQTASNRKPQTNSTGEDYNGIKREKQHQTKVACPLLDDPRLYLDIGTIGEVTQVKGIIDGPYVCPEDINSAVNTFLRHTQLPENVSSK